MGILQFHDWSSRFFSVQKKKKKKQHKTVCIHNLSYLLARHRESQLSSAKLFLPIIPIGIVALSPCTFAEQPLSKQQYTQQYTMKSSFTLPQNPNSSLIYYEKIHNVYLDSLLLFVRRSVRDSSRELTCDSVFRLQLASLSASVDNVPNSIFVKLARSAISPPKLRYFVINFGRFRWIVKGLAQLA